MKEILVVDKVNKFYGERLVLKDINIAFNEGDMVAIIGESGGGKTTLAKLIIGLEELNSGKILYEGVKLKSLKKRDFKYCADIQYIFQDPYAALEENKTVNEVLTEPIRICKRHKRNTLTPSEALEIVDKSLLSYMDKKIENLSGGQRQKVSIARALIPMPKIIIADECTSMLDEGSSEEVLNAFENIRENQRVTVLSIVHEVDFQKDPWNRIIVMKDGIVVEDLSFKEFQINCKSDYSKKLIESYRFLRGIENE